MLAPGGSSPPFGKLVVLAGTLITIQCTFTYVGAFGSGASGSSTIIANDLVAAGAPDHSTGGAVSGPSHVYSVGISPLAANAFDVTVSFAVAGGSGFCVPPASS